MNTMEQKSLRLLERLVSDWKFFEDFTREEIQEIIMQMSMHRINSEEIIFSEGDPGDYLFLILEGRVEIALTSNSMNNIIAILDEGSIVGEMAMLDSRQRSATAKALIDTEILILTEDKLNGLMGINPPLVAKIYRQLGKILTIRLRGMVGNLAEIS